MTEKYDTDTALGQWFAMVDGLSLPEHASGEPVRCDYCSAEVEAGERVTCYCVDDVINLEQLNLHDKHQVFSAPFAVARIYCLDCDRTEVSVPCGGYNELMVRATITEEKALTDFEYIPGSLSRASDGPPWDPVDLWETVMEIPFEEWSGEMGMAMGPEDIVDSLRVYDVDVRELIDQNGGINVASDRLAEIKQRRDERMIELLRSDPDEWDPEGNSRDREGGNA